jgi:hypothetical protein
LEQDAAPGLMDFTIPGAAPTHFTQRGRYAALFHDQCKETLTEYSFASPGKRVRLKSGRIGLADVFIVWPSDSPKPGPLC